MKIKILCPHCDSTSSYIQIVQYTIDVSDVCWDSNFPNNLEFEEIKSSWLDSDKTTFRCELEEHEFDWLEVKELAQRQAVGFNT